ncbi:DUF4044 domain-containing protein [Streptococcus sp. HF-1907]|nr:DUF4044 domain-containing protein [Streptococcus sp. HF-1907]MBF7095126.1 DUF4044 domain-containing protein [Streptococcus sp. HF-1907]
MAFGDNGQRKKTTFEKITLLVVLIMVVITVGSLIMSAVSAIM